MRHLLISCPEPKKFLTFGQSVSPGADQEAAMSFRNCHHICISHLRAVQEPNRSLTARFVKKSNRGLRL